MKKLNGIIFIFSLIILGACGAEKKEEKKADQQSSTENKGENKPDATLDSGQDWIDVQSKVSRMTSATTYDQILQTLGKPYDEYASPSVPEEYILFYNVPGVNGAIYWLIIDSETKTFLYWSGEKNEK